VARAQESGQLRPDAAAQDVPMLQLMIGTIIDLSRDFEPDLWRRFLSIVLRGLRADPGPPEPLEQPPPAPDRLQAMLSAWRPVRS
jgi:hypothetical protein